MVKELFYHYSSQKKGRGTPGRRLAAAIKKPGNAGVRFLGDCQCRAFRHFHALQRQKERQPCGRVGKLRPRASGEERAHALNHAVVFVAVVRWRRFLVCWNGMFGRVAMTPGHAHRFAVMVVGEHGHNERQDDDTPDAPELWSRTFLHACKGSDKILQAGCKKVVK